MDRKNGEQARFRIQTVGSQNCFWVVDAGFASSAVHCRIILKHDTSGTHSDHEDDTANHTARPRWLLDCSCPCPTGVAGRPTRNCGTLSPTRVRCPRNEVHQEGFHEEVENRRQNSLLLSSEDARVNISSNSIFHTMRRGVLPLLLRRRSDVQQRERQRRLVEEERQKRQVS